MKKGQLCALWILILFGIDYSVSQLLGFSLLYNRIHDLYIMGKLYAFGIGVSAFVCILLCKKDDEL